MIYFSVLGLICSDVQEEILDRPLPLGHFPIADRDVRRLHLLPQWQFTVFDILDLTCISQNCFFLEVANESVSRGWR